MREKKTEKIGSRERVRAVLSGQVPDRPPMRLRMIPETQKALEQYLGLQGDVLLDRLGIDLMRVSFVYSSPGNFKGEGCGVLEEDIFGVKRRITQNEFCAYQEITCSPLADAATTTEIEAHS